MTTFPSYNKSSFLVNLVRILCVESTHSAYSVFSHTPLMFCQEDVYTWFFFLCLPASKLLLTCHLILTMLSSYSGKSSLVSLLQFSTSYSCRSTVFSNLSTCWFFPIENLWSYFNCFTYVSLYFIFYFCQVVGPWVCTPELIYFLCSS